MKWKNQTFVKKSKEGMSKVPKQRKIQTKGLRLLVWGGVIVLSFSGVFAYWQAGMTATRVRSFGQEVKSIEQQVKKDDQRIQWTPELESFMNRFVSLYMNITTNQEVQEEREKMLLEDYYGKGMDLTMEQSDIERTLTSASFVRLAVVDDLKTASYKVSYTIKTKKDGQTLESKETQWLNVPYETNGKDCRVVVSPYFSSVPKNEYQTNFLGQETARLPLLDSSQEEKVETYVEEFLVKYAESSASDMRYMMKKPEGLEGTATFCRLNSCQMYQDKKGVLVKLSVIFKNEKTSLEWIEQMTLELIKKDKNYYVEKMMHHW
ncbi:TPA: conjugal transfer protein [Enterococcus hirae]